VSKCWKQEKSSWKRDGLFSQRQLGLGAPDCPVRQADSDELAALGTSTAAYGYKSPDCPVVHRTVRWCTDCPVSQQSAGPTVGRGIRSRRMAEQTVRRGTGLSGVYRTVSGAPTARNLQRSASPNKERDPHRTVRYARR
jgi:hypothetical protein